MSQSASARTPTRRPFTSIAVSLVVVTAAIIAIVVHQSTSSSAQPPGETLDVGLGGTTATAAATSPASTGTGVKDDGYLPDGVTVFDDQHAGVTKLNRDLLVAVRRAATDAADDGIEFLVNSGWRSPAYQNRLLREAVVKYGSKTEAARWVATAETSAHVSGDAIDLGPTKATAWLSTHGSGYGLCQIYRNEPWHYEWRPEAVEHGCPAMYPDPTHDPRMQSGERNQPLPPRHPR